MFPAAILILAWARSGEPTLSPALAVDVRVRSVVWRPKGDALLYSRDEATGVGLGVYGVGDDEGKVVLHLGAKDVWRCQWFGGSASALVTVERKSTLKGVELEGCSIYLFDVRKKQATEVFAKAVPAEVGLATEASLSPSLTHAIVAVHEGDKLAHYVLPMNGGRLVPSPDIDRAESKGLAGPGWTRLGTAIYGERTAGEPGKFIATDENGRELSLVLSTTSAEAARMVSSVTFTAESLSAFNVDGQVRSILLSIQPSVPAAPSAGKVALEVVPSNGVLRQVRSPGPWVGTPPVAIGATTQTRSMRLDVDGLSTETQGLCLFGGKGADAWRLVVAPKAEWGSLTAGAVAYAVDGALFVRRIAGR